MRNLTCCALAALVLVPAAAHADDDVSPAVTVVSGDDMSLTFGGLLQVHAAPYVGEDALLANDDPAQRAGLRLRRARVAFEARLPSNVSMLVVLNPLESDPESGAISDARITWSRYPYARLSIGADKVPFTHGELQSSAALVGIERPLGVIVMVPQRRLGVWVSGTVADEQVDYTAAVMNATEGYELGNQYDGLLYVGRASYHLRGGALEVDAGGGGYFEDGPASRVVAASVDARIGVAGAALRVEALCDRTTPIDSPDTAPGIPSQIDRCDAYAEATYDLENVGSGDIDVQPAARVEVVDDNRDLDDAGDGLLFEAGVNADLTPNLRVQLHYLGHHENAGNQRSNDAVILNVQGAF